MDRGRTPEAILSDIAAIPTLERGTLCPMRRGGSGPYYNLQFWRDGRNRCEYVRQADLPAVREAVGNWRRYQALTEEYAEALEGRTRQGRQAVRADRQKGGSTTRRCRRPAGR